MAVLRINKSSGYTVIDNNIFKNNNMSLKAKGLLCQMLSLPDCWEYSLEGLVTLTNDGITTVRSALKELEKLKYFKRRRLYENGKLAGVEYIISETPMSENLILENLKQENLNLENQGQLSTNSNKVSNKSNTYKDIADDYNSICTRLPKVEKLTDKRKTHIKTRLKERSQEEIALAFQKANESDFLCGINNRGWQADFDWLIKNSDNITKVLEGKYDNKQKLTKTEQELMEAYNKIGEYDDYRPFDG